LSFIYLPNKEEQEFGWLNNRLDVSNLIQCIDCDVG
jgi:hypothetical protein